MDSGNSNVPADVGDRPLGGAREPEGPGERASFGGGGEQNDTPSLPDPLPAAASDHIGMNPAQRDLPADFL